MNQITYKTDRQTESKEPAKSNHDITTYDMIVFCHLRWNFVYQRPHHIISRLSKGLKILFIEQPIRRFDQGHQLDKINDNLFVLQPNTSSIEEIPDIISEFIGTKNIPIGWFYSPAFSPLLEHFKFEHVIYDCMAELSLLKEAPQFIPEQEKYLMAHADVVITGGKFLYETKQHMHPNVYCFPSSVDTDHFLKAKSELPVPEDMADIPSPIVGFYGLIDERLDLNLLNETAMKMPQVSFVMIGPIAKIDENDLPKQKNIYYLGKKPYGSLPDYLRAFDIAMMPFALNESTKYLCPIQTLEYMAAGKPIISTKITDVVRDYLHCVKLISSSCEFYEEILDTLEEPGHNGYQDEYDKILEKTSWDSTLTQMKSIIQKSVKK